MPSHAFVVEEAGVSAALYLLEHSRFGVEQNCLGVNRILTHRRLDYTCTRYIVVIVRLVEEDVLAVSHVRIHAQRRLSSK
jgi:hypothetical protein